MVAPNALSDQDLAAVRTELSAGTPVTVWFTDAAVGVPAGKSAKVVALDDAAEGDFIQVKPAGTRDTVFCSPGELTRTRPPRRQAKQQATQQATQQTDQPPARPAGRATEGARTPAASAPEKAPARKPPAERPPAGRTPVVESPAEKAPAEKAPARPRAGGGRPAARPAEVTVTLNASADGEWTVEVAIGRKRTVRPTPVQPGDVAKAARSLPSAVAEAIESSLESARRRQVERVERLQAELDAAQRALHELSG